MNMISKRLLSWLCVIAMVLSFVPVMDLGNFAVETNAAETVTPGQANLPEGVAEEIAKGNTIQIKAKETIAEIPAEGGSFTGYCPVCERDVSWTQINSSKTNMQSKNESDKVYHAYVNTEVTRAGNVFGIYVEGTGNTSKNNTMCVLLGDEAVISNTKTRFVMMGGTNNVLNIMGTGTVTTNVGTNDDYGMFQLSTGTVNLYGGTYILEDDDAYYAAVRLNGGTLNMYAEATIGPAEAPVDGHCYNVAINHASSVFNMYGGTIRNGVSHNAGLSGNVTVTSSGRFNMYGGTIKGGRSNTGVSTYGGNVLVGAAKEWAKTGTRPSNTSGKFYMYGGTIEDGIVGNSGGNIAQQVSSSVLEIHGGTIANGKTTGTGGGNWGGNIRVWNGNLTIKGGLIYGGYCANTSNGYNSSNIGCMGGETTTAASLTIEGGVIVGGVVVNGSKTYTVKVADTNDVDGDGDTTEKTIEEQRLYPGTTLVLKNAPKIVTSYVIDGKTVTAQESRGLTVPNNANADISELSSDAEIRVTGSHNYVFTAASDNAANVVDCFTPTSTALYVKENSSKQLVMTYKEMGIVSMGASGKEEIVRYETAAEAMAAYYESNAFEAGKFLRAFVSAPLELNGDAYIDSYGNNNIVVSGTGKLYAMDYSDHDYEGNYKQISSTWKVGGEVEVVNDVTNPVNGYRYIVIENTPDSGEYSAHRIEVELTHVTLRTDKAGYYYKASYKMDDYLASRVTGYGVVLSAANMPGADFMTELGDINKYTLFEGQLTPDAETHMVENVTSGGLWGILKDPTVAQNERTAEENYEAAQKYVYANVYLKVNMTGSEDPDDVAYFVADTENANKTVADSDFSGVAHSLLDVLEGINDNWTNYNDAQQTLIQNTINTWTDWIPADKASVVKTQLSNIFPQ